MSKKKTEKDTIFSQSTINNYDTFEYVIENKSFEAFYRCYEDIFNLDCKKWPRKKYF